MSNSFEDFLTSYLECWRTNSLSELKNIISKNYKAREVTNEAIQDFGYEESIQGWQGGFTFVRENEAKWVLRTLAVLPLRKEEVMVIISATIERKDETLTNGNLFFQTFKKENSDSWHLVRSYIEAGISEEYLNKFLNVM